jgi:hypothetical protein
MTHSSLIAARKSRFPVSGSTAASAVVIGALADDTRQRVIADLEKGRAGARGITREGACGPREPGRHLCRFCSAQAAANFRASALLRRLAVLRWMVPRLTARSRAELSSRACSAALFLSFAATAAFDLREMVFS